jgi:hypothetical protein
MMNLTDLLSNIHWLPVTVITIVSFALGAAWHMPMFFGNVWKEENNAHQVKQQINAPLVFGGTAIVHFMAISGLSAVVSGHGGEYGFLAGLFISIVWAGPVMTGTYLFANRSLKILAIDFGMYLVLFSLGGMVLGIW